MGQLHPHRGHHPFAVSISSLIGLDSWYAWIIVTRPHNILLAPLYFTHLSKPHPCSIKFSSTLSQAWAAPSAVRESHTTVHAATTNMSLSCPALPGGHLVSCSWSMASPFSPMARIGLHIGPKHPPSLPLTVTRGLACLLIQNRGLQGSCSPTYLRGLSSQSLLWDLSWNLSASHTPTSHSCGYIWLFDGVNIFSMSKQAVLILLSMCGHLNNGPEMSTTFTPRICECVTLHGKRNFADTINSRDLEMGDHPRLPWIISEAQSNPMVLKSRKLTSFGQRKRDVTIEKSQRDSMVLAVKEEEGPKAKNLVASRNWKRQETHSPLEPLKEPASLTHLDLSREPHGISLTSRT